MPHYSNIDGTIRPVNHEALLRFKFFLSTLFSDVNSNFSCVLAVIEHTFYSSAERFVAFCTPVYR